jgi:hypothetical protein
MTERMYVRVGHTRQDVKYVDESNSRVITDLREERWQEYIVVWRRKRLELYSNHVSPIPFHFKIKNIYIRH